MSFRKLSYRLALLLLTAGASLILGLLSFSGMFALWPVLPLAFVSFILSVAYEGEIYLQNIKGALTKLLRLDYQEIDLARQYLLKHVEDAVNTPEHPVFFDDYKKTLLALHQLGEHVHTRQAKKQFKHLKAKLKDMEHWFALQLFDRAINPAVVPTAYEATLQDFLLDNEQGVWQLKLQKRQRLFFYTKVFSVVAATFMGLGTTYLLMEAFAVVPLLMTLSPALLPFLIVPMALLAGSAYGLLTFNALNDMIAKDTFQYWYNKIRADLRQNFGVRSVIMAFSAVLLASLAIALTICTAGTWWTVAKNTAPLFQWMGRMPSYVMGVINPIITGLSAVVFNLQNTSESLELVDEAVRDEQGFWHRFKEGLKQGFFHVRQRENLLQLLNPFRFVLKIAVLPLRIILFLGHLISIGVTADRVPGVSKTLSALLGIVSEGFEDAHYFVGHVHHHDTTDEAPSFKSLLHARLAYGHSHSHDLDLPTRALKLILSPIYLMAAIWDSLASQKHDIANKRLSLKQAWLKQQGESEPCHEHEHHNHNHEHGHEHEHAEEADVSLDWRVHQALHQLSQFQHYHLDAVCVGQANAREKAAQLNEVSQHLRQNKPQNEAELVAVIHACATSPVLSQHRFFAAGQTKTAAFMRTLETRLVETHCH